MTHNIVERRDTMVLKNSPEYDSILHIDADHEFIKSIFSINLDNLEQGKIQLLAEYAKEHAENLQNCATIREKELAIDLNIRNIALIEMEYSYFRIKQLEKSYENNEDFSIADAMLNAELNYLAANNDLKAEKTNLSILRNASLVEDQMIWGKERDTRVYEQALEIKNATNYDGTTIGELEYDLKMAMDDLNLVYKVVKEKTANSQDNLNADTKKQK